MKDVLREEAVRLWVEACARTKSSAIEEIYHSIMAIHNAALEEARADEREKIAAWIEPQRNDVPMTGYEAANAIRKLKVKP